MPRACTTCSHPDRKSIDARIANREPYRNIAERFGLNHVSVTRHGQNHVKPFLDSIELQAQAVVLERVMAYRDEVNLPLPEQAKVLMDKLWGDFDAADEPQDRVAIAKAITLQRQELAKLTGAYIKDAANPATTKQIAEDIAQQLIAKGWDEGEARDVALREAGKIPEVSQAVN